jgi:hypothetical protein
MPVYFYCPFKIDGFEAARKTGRAEESGSAAGEGGGWSKKTERREWV